MQSSLVLFDLFEVKNKQIPDILDPSTREGALIQSLRSLSKGLKKDSPDAVQASSLLHAPSPRLAQSQLSPSLVGQPGLWRTRPA